MENRVQEILTQYEDGEIDIFTASKRIKRFFESEIKTKNQKIDEMKICPICKLPYWSYRPHDFCEDKNENQLAQEAAETMTKRMDNVINKMSDNIIKKAERVDEKEFIYYHKNK